MSAAEIEQAQRFAEIARRAYENAGDLYATHLKRVAALMVREQLPTAALLVFEMDEDTVTADTEIEIVAVHDADGGTLPTLDGPTAQEIQWRLVEAYDAGEGGHFNVADQDVYDTETVGSEWQDKNLLTLDIDIATRNPSLPAVTRFEECDICRAQFDTEAALMNHIGEDH